ncbi:MAG: pyridoxal-phosphate dependent enzyme [Bradyrhizobium sp.]|uniref:pyridoxal-phosphate dependent enzyme n=1 Tax=Bradyrhizobium sp. TaxID=376 RepID=UPI0027314560|nr:pyridoxal-phosphate dependent enzyme [Bradyrhizobium sp.]MDP1868987.1 pyridoxal-phosphate dependent enzyme [Bradyrhizobium sp.]
MNASRPAFALNPRLLGFRCIRCDVNYPVGDYAEGCPACSAAKIPASVVPTYSSLLPLADCRHGRGASRFGPRLGYSTFPTLGEGGTPVARLHRLADELGLDAVDIKLEGSNPTGSHKDRMTSQFVARALAKGAPVVAAASSGNAGASLAAYAAAAGLRCAIVTTPKMSPPWRRAIELSGAELHFVEDPLERWRLIGEKGKSDGWFSATNICRPPTSSEPFGVEGYKTLAYELAENPQTADADTILVPTARGDLLWGIYAGFAELVAEKLLPRMPRLVAVEPFPRIELALAGADYRGGFAGSSPLLSINGTTVTYQAIAAAQRSGGAAVSVNSGDVVADQRYLSKSGHYLELSAVAALTGLRVLLANKPFAVRHAVLIATSHGYKENQG